MIGELDEFEEELRAAPWAYGQRQPQTFLEILARMRVAGLDTEADWLLREWTILSQK